MPPVSICVELAKKILYGHFDYTKDSLRFLNFCEHVLLISLSQVEPSKNIVSSKFIIDNNFQLILKIFNQIFQLLNFKIKSKSFIISTTDCERILLPTLALLVGNGEPFKMKFPQNLREIFQQIRHILVEGIDSKQIQNTHQNTNIRIHQTTLFQNIRNSLYTRIEVAHMASVGEEDGVAISHIHRPIQNCLGDLALGVCMFVIEVDGNLVACRLKEFARYV